MISNCDVPWRKIEDVTDWVPRSKAWGSVSPAKDLLVVSGNLWASRIGRGKGQQRCGFSWSEPQPDPMGAVGHDGTKSVPTETSGQAFVLSMWWSLIGSAPPTIPQGEHNLPGVAGIGGSPENSAALSSWQPTHSPQGMDAQRDQVAGLGHDND